MKPKLSDLTTEQKRVLCAEACGKRPWWKCEIHSEVDGPTCPWCKSAHQVTREEEPPYDTSLDAMATAEATLKWNETDAYLDALARVVDPVHGYRMELTFGIATATAAHRLDAFLIAEGLCE